MRSTKVHIELNWHLTLFFRIASYAINKNIHFSTHERTFFLFSLFMSLLSKCGVVLLTQKNHKIGLLLGMFMIKLRAKMWLKMAKKQKVRIFKPFLFIINNTWMKFSFSWYRNNLIFLRFILSFHSTNNFLKVLKKFARKRIFFGSENFHGT